MFGNIDIGTQTYRNEQGVLINAKTGQPVANPSQQTPEQIAAAQRDASATSGVIASSGIRRFTPATTGTYPTEASRIISSLKTTAPTATDEASIREQQLKAVQAQLDSIDQETSAKIADEAVRAAGRLGQGRSINARSGVLGSDMGGRRTSDIEGVNKQARDAIYAAQEAKRQEVLGNADARATQLIENEKNRALQNADTYLKYLASVQDAARSDIKSLASSGVSLDQLDDAQYQKLLDQSGYGSEFLFDAVYNSQLPANQKSDFEYINIGNGRIVRYDKTHPNNAPQEFDYSVPDGYQFKMAGDIPVFVNEKTQDVKIAAPGGDMASAAQYAKETELDSFTDANGNRVSVMYNPVSKATRKIVLGKAKDDSSAYPTGFKPQAFEVSAVNQFISSEGSKQGQSRGDIDAALKRVQSDPGFFYATLSAILANQEYSNTYYKPVTLGIPSSFVQQQ